MDFGNLEGYGWWALPALIFIARVIDVTLGTLRIVFLARGQRLLAPLLGFFEVLIWIMAIGQIVRDISNVSSYIAYAAGFATGNYIGLVIEQKLAIGMLVIRAIVPTQANMLAERLREQGYGVTTVDAHGAVEEVTIIFTVIKRKDLLSVVAIITQNEPKAFFSVEEVRSVREGVFRASAPPAHSSYLHTLLNKRR